MALVVSGAGLAVISRVDWPAFNSSNVATALTTTGQVAAIVILFDRGGRCSRTGKAGRLVKPLSWVGISSFAAVTLAMPLGATKLYLFGISVDQQFRTEYLTRLTDSPRLADMTYADLPPYYPAGWFWLGGRYASLTGQPGWEAYKPWAIISIAVAATIAMVLWQRMIRTDRAIAVTLASTVLTLMYVSPEPYAAVLVVVGAPMLITILHGLRSGSRPAHPGRRTLPRRQRHLLHALHRPLRDDRGPDGAVPRPGRPGSSSPTRQFRPAMSGRPDGARSAITALRLAVDGCHRGPRRPDRLGAVPDRPAAERARLRWYRRALPARVPARCCRRRCCTGR